MKPDSRKISSITWALSSLQVVQGALPLVDFDRMGTVGLAGSFAGLDFFNSTTSTFDPSTSTLLTRSSTGSLTRIGATNPGGNILAGCTMKDIFYFGGSFSTVEGTSASNVAMYDASKNSFASLGNNGVDGTVDAIFCDQSGNRVWVGGSFGGLSSGGSGFGGAVAVYSVKDKSWSPPPFKGLDGTVFSITPSSSATSSLLFAGSFNTSFTGTNNGTTVQSTAGNPNVPSSSGATPFSSSLVPISIPNGAITASPSSSQSGFGNISSILCPAGPDGPGNTWLAQDGFKPFINVMTNSFLTATGLRLGNTFVQGRGTKTFTVTTIPTNVVLTLNFTDPTTGQANICSTDCPLLQDSSIPYQDFLIQGPLDFTGVQITLTQWSGSGAGLHLLQILSDGAFASAVASQNGVSCFAPGASSTSQEGNWTPKTVVTTLPATTVQVLLANVSVGTSSSQAPSFTWDVYASAPGNYAVNLLVPGCINLQDCDARTTVKVTISPGGGLEPVSKTIFQQVNTDSAQEIYNGPVFPSGPDFKIPVMLELADSPAGNGENGMYQLVADRIQMRLLSAITNGTSTGPSSGGSNGTTTTAGFGLFEWNLSDSNTVDATGVLPNSTETQNDITATELASALSSINGASIRAVAVHSSGAVFLGGQFTFSSGSANIVAFKNKVMVGLQGSGLNGVVDTLAIDGDTLFAGGSFTDTPSHTGAGSFQGVVSYDINGDTWHALQAGVNGPVTSLIVSNDQVLMTGNFTTLLDSANGTSGAFSEGFAAWNIKNNSWAQAGGFLVGKMSLVSVGANNDDFLAGNVQAALKFGSDGFVTISNGNANGPLITPLKVQLESVASSSSGSSQPASPGLLARWTDLKGVKNIFMRQSSTQTLPPPISAKAPAVLAGAFWTDSSRQMTVIGGNFTFNSGGVSAENLALYDAASGALKPLGGPQVNGTIYSLLVQGNKLYVGGAFTLANSAQGGNGFAIYDLDSQQWDTKSVAAIQGSNVIVRSITNSTSKDHTIFVAGSFTGVSGTSNCAGICALDTDSGQWSALGGGIQGEVASVDFAGTNSELLVAGGAFSVNGVASNVASFGIANTTWTALGENSKVPGSVLTLAVNNKNASSIFASGPSSDSSGPFLAFWNGISWNVLSNSTLGTSSSVQQIMLVPLQDDHDANGIIEADRMLMLSGTLESTTFGNASAALFDGNTFIPYITTTTSSGSLGSIAALFHSLSSFSFNRRHFLATGVVILISIAIAAGIVFLLVLIGILWTLCIRRDQDSNKAYVGFDDDDSMHSGAHGPSSLLEHINAATRGAIMGAASPFDTAARQKEVDNRSAGLTPDPDPFAAETQDTHGSFVPADEAVPTAVGGDEELPRRTHVRYSFDGAGEGELSLAQGMQVDVLDSNDTAWWYVRDANGREGVVPASYLY